MTFSGYTHRQTRTTENKNDNPSAKRPRPPHWLTVLIFRMFWNFRRFANLIRWRNVRTGARQTSQRTAKSSIALGNRPDY